MTRFQSNYNLRWCILFCTLTLGIGCSNKYDKSVLEDPELFQDAMQNLTDIIVYDIFSPPVASRVYVYPTVGAYEVMRLGSPQSFKSLAGQLGGLKPLPQADDPLVDYHLAALYVFNTLGKELIFSEDKMDAFQAQMEEKIQAKGVPTAVRKASKVYAQQAGSHIHQWYKQDYYDQTRTAPKYTILEGQKFWKPTPPDYMDGIEPHWREIRTLVLDSAAQFAPKPPLPFDLTEGTAFQKQLMEVFQVGETLTDEQIEIAKFWDCNPYVTHHRGHAMFATKKITPGGHWIGITSLVTRKAQANFGQTIATYAEVTVALFDAFISCWDEKWNSLVVRPETLINELYDEEWMPLLQTPPFPEYTSGHSVISRAAATVLTKLYGPDFPFTDTTEQSYGLPARSYTSFYHASEEAAISRLYGGIHYMMAIEEGVNQGQAVGNLVASRLVTQLPEAGKTDQDTSVAVR
ncbi:MAG: vanadium-dependent haloperoxidase [Flavobacteriaceae bacterium]